MLKMRIYAQISFLFADADERGAVSQVKSDFIHRPDAISALALKPFERGHFYWKLEEPVQPTDFEAVEGAHAKHCQATWR